MLETSESLKLEEQRRRAEADRLAAMTALKALGKEILAEKEAEWQLDHPPPPPTHSTPHPALYTNAKRQPWLAMVNAAGGAKKEGRG